MAEKVVIYGECEEPADDRVLFIAKFAGTENPCVISRSALELLAKGGSGDMLYLFNAHRERIAEVARRRLAMNLGVMPILTANDFQIG
ncbi:MAG: hypothetical protein JWQ10_2437 [Herbaspirillum sp.]|jgi:hypothetical protein|nr:hypothetical protein [Herbaspirillum sp.]